MGVVLEGLADSAIRLGGHRPLDHRRLRQRPRQGLDHEPVGLLGEREAVALAARADHSPRGAGEGGDVVALAAAGAARQLRREAGGQRQLQAEGERRAGGAGEGRIDIEQRQVVAEQVVGGLVCLLGAADAR